jgi:hypothetical protein
MPSLAAFRNLSSAQPLTLSRKVADAYLRENLLQTETTTLEPTSEGFSDPIPSTGYFDPHSHEVFSFTVSNGNLMSWEVHFARATCVLPEQTAAHPAAPGARQRRQRIARQK